MENLHSCVAMVTVKEVGKRGGTMCVTDTSNKKITAPQPLLPWQHAPQHA